MYQTLIDKCADILLPIGMALFLWFILHYAILAPRLLHADMPAFYDTQMRDASEHEHPLPNDVHHCLRKHYSSAMLNTARFETALRSATLNHYNKPFQQQLLPALQSLDQQCGTSKAIQTAREQQRRANEEAARLAKEKLKLFALPKLVS